MNYGHILNITIGEYLVELKFGIKSECEFNWTYGLRYSHILGFHKVIGRVWGGDGIITRHFRYGTVRGDLTTDASLHRVNTIRLARRERASVAHVSYDIFGSVHRSASYLGI